MIRGSLKDIIRELYAQQAVPRVHGNGFIQLDVDKDHRLHFWGHPQIPQQTVRTPIHDHTFDFTSTVFRGRVYSIMYSVKPDPHGAYQIFEARPDGPSQGEPWPTDKPAENTQLVPTHQLVSAETLAAAVAGECSPREYFCPRSMFHESLSDGPAISMIQKHPRYASPGRPRVLVPVRQEPDNAFDRDAFDHEMLWGIIKELAA